MILTYLFLFAKQNIKNMKPSEKKLIEGSEKEASCFRNVLKTILINLNTVHKLIKIRLIFKSYI